MAAKKRSSRAVGKGSRAVDGSVSKSAANILKAPEDPRSPSLSARRFVLISDLHAHAWSAFAKGSGASNTRLRRSLSVLEASLAKAHDLGCPWVFAGDIVETAGFTVNEVLSEIIDVLDAFPDVIKLAVWGNHDARGVGGKIEFGQTVLKTIQRAVPNVIVLDPSAKSPGDCASSYTDPKSGLTFSGAGYQPRGDLLQHAAPSDVGIYHQTVRGTKTPNGFVLEEGLSTDELLKRHRITVVGHIHHWQYPSERSKHANMVLVPGSPEHQNFGDQGEHGWWVVTLGAGHSRSNDWELEFVAGGSPKFLTVETPRQVKQDGNFYRVSSVGAGEILPEGVEVVAPSPTVVANRDVLRGAKGRETLSVWLAAEPPVGALPVERYLAAGAALLGSQQMENLRPYRLSRVVLKDFCSYKEQTYVVTPGTWLVTGQGRDFPSNGAGKSTLFEAIFWALFGRTTKGLSGDDVIRWGAKACSVSVLFNEDSRDWLTVSRSRGDSSRLEVEDQHGAFEAKSVVEMTEKLQRHLGITPELYQALGYFSQEKLLLFASATDGERKDMLADLIGLSAYQEASSTAQRQYAELDVQAQRIQARQEATQTQLESENKRLAEIVERSRAWEEARKEREQEARRAVVQFDKEEKAARKKLMVAARESIGRSVHARKAAFEESITALHAAVDSSKGIQVDTPQRLAEVSGQHAKALAKVNTLKSRIDDKDRQRAALEVRIEKQRQDLSIGVCPSCGQTITEAHQARCLAPVLDDLATIASELDELRVARGPALEAAVLLRKEVLDAERGVAAAGAIAMNQNNLRVAERQLAAINAELETVEADAESHVNKVLRDGRLALERGIIGVVGELNPYRGEEAGSVSRRQETTVETTRLEQELLVLAEAMAIMDYWRQGFSKQGIQSLLVDEVAGLFNQARGSIFPALTQGVYDVQFSTVSQTKGGEWREKTEFQVFEHGRLVPYAVLSGGQRRRVDVGVMLTLVKVVSRWMQVPGVLGHLVLDEVFGFLDASGAEGLLEALREVQKEVPAIFVVSHDQQLQALFPDTINVEQGEDGISRITTGAS